MVKTELLRIYELVVIVDAKLSNEEKESIFKNVVEAVTKAGGKVVNSQVWMERHKLTFKINRCNEGSYYLINFEGEGVLANNLNPVLRLNEKILRFLIIQVE